MVNTSDTTHSSASINRNVWRVPGYYEMPNIIGNAYLKPDPPVTLDLRPVDHTKQITKRPWYPPSPYSEIPPLPPLARTKSRTPRRAETI
ncbi:hypothetical protein K501DRAFT_86024 [Backusella circina FSU 941]|nr:hypothetical protein K501DRAFT_86024 [Backusella circina FSU 941]